MPMTLRWTTGSVNEVVEFIREFRRLTKSRRSYRTTSAFAKKFIVDHMFLQRLELEGGIPPALWIYCGDPNIDVAQLRDSFGRLVLGGMPHHKSMVDGVMNEATRTQLFDLLYELVSFVLDGTATKSQRALTARMSDLCDDLLELYTEDLSVAAPVVVPPNDARDAWLYDQLARNERGALVKQERVLTRLHQECKKRDWRDLRDINSAKLAANRWAKRNGRQPIPKRPHGRPKQKSK